MLVAACTLSLVVVSRGYWWLRCPGSSLLSLLWSVDSGARGLQELQCVSSVVVAHELRCSAARGIFPDQGSNPCPMHR